MFAGGSDDIRSDKRHSFTLSLINLALEYRFRPRFVKTVQVGDGASAALFFLPVSFGLGFLFGNNLVIRFNLVRPQDRFDLRALFFQDRFSLGPVQPADAAHLSEHIFYDPLHLFTLECIELQFFVQIPDDNFLIIIPFARSCIF